MQNKFEGIAQRRAIMQAMSRAIALTALSAVFLAIPLLAQSDKSVTFQPGNLVVSRAVYDNNPNNVKVGEILPPNCASTMGGCSGSGGATNNGTFPYVFNNALYDGSFGITSAFYLDEVNPFTGAIDKSVPVPNNVKPGDTSDELVTSFSSKSELSLHLSTDYHYVTFMGYVAPVDALDVSNSNTPGEIDPTNPVGESYYRAVGQVDGYGHFSFTETNAYSGNNGRAAILNNEDGHSLFYTAGNAGNGSNPQPEGVVLGAGAQLIDALDAPEKDQYPNTPTPFASFSVTQLGDKADKIGKDDNFRGITIFNNVVYFTKGSGGNGVNTVYFVDTTGKACPSGVGLPVAGAKLPTSLLDYNPADLETTGLPNNMCILAGFPDVPVKKATTVSYPFGLFFADGNTLYVADEGDEYAGGPDLYTHAAAQTTAGLQKWIFNSSTRQWTLAYVITNGLDLGIPYTVSGYPTGTNSATGLPWAPATDGLRNINGYTSPNGTVYIWAVTSTTSGGGDTGADPNRLVLVTDKLWTTTAAAAASDKFVTLQQAGFAEALRGVSFTPNTYNFGAEHGW